VAALVPTEKLLAVSKADQAATSKMRTSNPGNNAGLLPRMLPHGSSNVVGIIVVATTMVVAVMTTVAATMALLRGPKAVVVVATMAMAPRAVTVLQVLLQVLPPALLHGSSKLLRHRLLEAKQVMATDILVATRLPCLALLPVLPLVFQAPLQAWILCTMVLVLERLHRLPLATDLLLL
jgi:hypothetical protein